MAVATADLYDELGESIQSLALQLASFGGVAAFDGPIRTIRCFEDNVLVRQVLSEPGAGGVLVVDGGGSLRRALLGDQIGRLAVDSGWAGVVVHGAVRDRVALASLPIGIRALGSNPRKSTKDGGGEVDVPLEIDGVRFRPGAHLYADEDGVLVER